MALQTARVAALQISTTEVISAARAASFVTGAFSGAVTMSSTATVASSVGVGTIAPDRLSAGATARVLSVMGDVSTRRGRLEIGTIGGASTTANLGSITAINDTAYMGAIDFKLAGATNSSQIEFRTVSAGTTVVALTVANTGAATFAGSVTVMGDVGFYAATPVAKQTGVAVTAAGVHAALVNLGLIAA